MLRYVSHAFLFTSLIVLLVACKTSPDYTREVAVTDSLKTALVKAANDFNQLDSQRVRVSQKTIEAYLDFINRNLRDTIDRNDALTLSNFKMVNKSLGKYSRTQRQLRNFYAHNIKQLDDLAYDLQKGNINSADSARKYIQSEKEANTMLINSLIQHTQIIPKELIKYDSLKPMVETFIKKINNGTMPPDLERAGD